MKQNCSARFKCLIELISNAIKWQIILKRKLQKILLWIGILLIIFTMSVIITVPLVWFCCFLLLLYVRTIGGAVDFSLFRFYQIWIIISALESASVLRKSFKSGIFSADDIAVKFRWNWIKRWAWTPVLDNWFDEHCFKEETIGPSGIILDFAFGVVKRPAWSDMWIQIDEGNILDNLKTRVFEDRYPWSWTVFASRQKGRRQKRRGVCKMLPYMVSFLVSLLLIQIKFWIFAPGCWLLHEVCWLPFTASYIIGIYLIVVAPIQMLRHPRPKTLKAACFCAACGLIVCLITRLISRVFGFHMLGQRLRFSMWNNLVWIVYFASHDVDSQKDFFDWLRENRTGLFSSDTLISKNERYYVRSVPKSYHYISRM